jgi:hypothetical protein
MAIFHAKAPRKIMKGHSGEIINLFTLDPTPRSLHRFSEQRNPLPMSSIPRGLPRGYLLKFIKIKIPDPRGEVLKFTATESVAEEKTNAANCGVLTPQIKIKLLP